MAISEKYRCKDFTNQSFKHLPASEFNITIRGSCLSQECTHGNVLPIDGVDIFPDGIDNLILDGCNLDNVNTNKPGITVLDDPVRNITTSQRMIMADDEGFDCLVKDNGGVLEPDKTKRI